MGGTYRTYYFYHIGKYLRNFFFLSCFDKTNSSTVLIIYITPYNIIHIVRVDTVAFGKPKYSTDMGFNK